MGKEAERNQLKNEVLETVMELMRDRFETDVLRTDTSKFMMPGVDKDGNEFYFQVEISIPRGKRNGEGGYTPYNGYEEAETYRLDMEAKAAENAAKAEKKKAAEKEKEKKRADKQQAREAKAALAELKKVKVNMGE